MIGHVTNQLRGLLPLGHILEDKHATHQPMALANGGGSKIHGKAGSVLAQHARLIVTDRDRRVGLGEKRATVHGKIITAGEGNLEDVHAVLPSDLVIGVSQHISYNFV